MARGEGRVTIVLLVAVLLLTTAGAQTTYSMTENSVCDKAGFETVPTGSTVRVMGQGSRSGGDRLTCFVRLTVAERDVQLRLTYRSVNINDCGVELHVNAYGDPATDTVRCGPAPTLNPKTSSEGKIVIRLDRRNINDIDFNFDIMVEAFKPAPVYANNDSNPVAVGLVAGVVGGIIGFLVLLGIMGYCCYKRLQRAKMREREKEYKQNLAEIEGADGYTNKLDQNGMLQTDEYHDSPRGKRKLLSSKNYRDEVGPNERSVDASPPPPAPPPPPCPITDMATSPSKKSAFTFDKAQMKKEDKAGTGRPARDGSPETPKSPILAALHSNAKFRATFKATEADAENRAQRISVYSTGGESQSSLASQASSQAPPPLPSVPKVPKSPASRRQNHASIRRAQRLSSGDDIPRSSESDDDPNIQVIHSRAPPASPSEVVAIKTQDPHSAEPKQKFDTTHTLRPNRGKSPQNKQQQQQQAAAKGKDTRPADLDSVAGRSMASSQGGMFKKANSLRKRSGKSPRLGRASRSSVGNALDEMDSRPTTPTSMRGFDDDLDDYPPLKRTASRQSLYASRSSLYNRRGRRERNNSIGESFYSFAHDDIDAYRHRYDDDDDYEDVMPRRMSRRSFRSLGDLEYAMRETATQTLRETATQTGKGQAFVPSSKLRASKKKSGSSKSLGAAVALSVAEPAAKGTKKSGKNAETNTGGTPKSARKASSADNLDAVKGKEERPKRKKSTTKITSTETGEGPAAEIIAGNTSLPGASTQITKPPKPKPKPKPRPLPRKSQSNAANPADEDEGEEGAEGTQGVAPTQQAAPAPPTTVPSMAAPQPGVVPMMMAPQYVMTPQGLVLAQPYPQMQPMYPGAQAPLQTPGNPPMQTALPPQLHAVNAGSGGGGGSGRPSRTNWDLLCDITAGHQAGPPSDIASVSGSVFSSAIPPSSLPGQSYAGPGNYGGSAYPSSLPAYAQMSAALSDHGSYSYEAGRKQSHTPQSSSSSSRGTPPMASSTPPQSKAAKKSSWEALQEATNSKYRLAYGSQTQPSGGTESIV